IGKDETNEDGLALKIFLIEELSACAVELSNRGNLQDRVFAVGPVQAPLVRLRVVQAERDALNVSARPVDRQLAKVRAAIPELADYRSAVVINPTLRAA